ncbi:hypothetical protein D3C86_794380 [compost metagenome]
MVKEETELVTALETQCKHLDNGGKQTLTLNNKKMLSLVLVKILLGTLIHLLIYHLFIQTTFTGICTKISNQTVETVTQETLL